MTAIIGHLDMDAFFAAVEELDKPWLKGSPVVIGADPKGGVGRGVVSTANYMAREYGIHSALPISKAWQYSEKARRGGKPQAMFLTPSFKRYSDISREIVKVVEEHVSRIQVAGVDEMYLDFTPTGSYEAADKLARKIKRAVKQKIKLTCSVGIGPNKMIAKIASDFEKPDGLTVVRSENAGSFIENFSVRAIPGIGPKMEEKLRRLGVRTVKDLRKISESELTKRFGKWGGALYERARGKASAELSEEHAIKSIGEHETFAENTRDMKYVLKRLGVITKDIVGRLKKKKLQGFRTTVLTVRFADFETKQRSVTTKETLHTERDLELKAMKLVLPFFDKKENPHNKAIRMIGLRIEKLV